MNAKKLLISACSSCFLLSISLQGQVPYEPEVDMKKIASYLAVEESDNMAGISSEIDELLQSPVNLNSDRVSFLSELRLISGYQLGKLAEYRESYGDLVTANELFYIDGWDSATIQRISRVIQVAPSPARGFRIGDLVEGRNQLVIKTKRLLEIPRGFRSGLDMNEKPHYSGSQDYISFRYDYNLGDRIRAGLRFEKDAGEPWLPDAELATVRVKAPDFYSGFLSVSNIGFIKTICIGNYQVRFGQGINLGSGAGIDQGGTSVIRTVSGLRTYTSMTEGGYLSGAASSIKTGPIETNLFFSSRKIDVTGPEFDSLGHIMSFTSVNTSGLHRSLTEIGQKKLVNERIYGFTAVYSRYWLRAGITGITGKYSVPVRESRQAYAKYSFKGNEFSIFGSEIQLIIRKFHIMSELSLNLDGRKAFKSAIYLLPYPFMKAGISYAHFDAGYTNPVGNRPSAAIENSVYAAMEFQFPKRWTVLISLEKLSRPWISYQQDAPLHHTIARIMAGKNFQENAQVEAILRFSARSTTYDSQNSYLDHFGNSRKWNFSFQYLFRPIHGMDLKTIAEMVFYEETGKEIQKSIVVCQEARYRSASGKLDLWLRLGLFDVQGYDSRIYLYENDLLFDFSSHALTGSGWRGVLTASYKPLRWLQVQLKAGRFIYEAKKSVGSGWDETEGNKRTEIKLQLISKF